MRNRVLLLLGATFLLLVLNVGANAQTEEGPGPREGAAAVPPLMSEALLVEQEEALWDRQRDEIRALDERDVVDRFPTNVVRDGSTLFIHAENGEVVTFEDINCDCDGYKFVRIYEYVEGINSFLVYEGHYEWSEWYLVHRQSGAVQWVPSAVDLSPSADRFIGGGSIDYDEYAFAIIRVENGQFVEEFYYAGTCYDDMRWIDEGRVRVFLRLRMYMFDSLAQCAGIDPDDPAALNTHFDLTWDGINWIRQPMVAP